MKQESVYFVQKISIRPDCLFFEKEFIIHIDLSKIWFINQTVPKNIQSELRRKNEKSKTDRIGCNCIQHSHGAFDTGAGERKEYLLVNGDIKTIKGNRRAIADVLSRKRFCFIKRKGKKIGIQKSDRCCKAKKIKVKLKIADTCKITFADEDEKVTGYYKDWITNGGGGDYKEGDEMCFITVNIKVRNKKIVKIIFSR